MSYNASNAHATDECVVVAPQIAAIQNCPSDDDNEY